MERNPPSPGAQFLPTDPGRSLVSEEESGAGGEGPRGRHCSMVSPRNKRKNGTSEWDSMDERGWAKKEMVREKERGKIIACGINERGSWKFEERN